MKRIILSYEKLSLFRDLKISLSDLLENGKYNVKDIASAITDNGKDVEICTEHVINILSKFRKKEISEEQLLIWIKIVETSGPFIVSEESDQVHDCIEGVLKNILLVEMGMKIDDSDINRYIEALNNNIILDLELDRLPQLHRNYSKYYKQ